MEDFLQSYLGKWEEETRNTAGLSWEEHNRLILSKQTRHRWNMTGVSFMHIISSSTQSTVGMFRSFHLHLQVRFEVEGGCFDGNMSQLYHFQVFLTLIMKGSDFQTKKCLEKWDFFPHMTIFVPVRTLVRNYLGIQDLCWLLGQPPYCSEVEVWGRSQESWRPPLETENR